MGWARYRSSLLLVTLAPILLLVFLFSLTPEINDSFSSGECTDYLGGCFASAEDAAPADSPPADEFQEVDEYLNESEDSSGSESETEIPTEENNAEEPPEPGQAIPEQNETGEFQEVDTYLNETIPDEPANGTVDEFVEVEEFLNETPAPEENETGGFFSNETFQELFSANETETVENETALVNETLPLNETIELNETVLLNETPPFSEANESIPGFAFQLISADGFSLNATITLTQGGTEVPVSASLAQGAFSDDSLSAPDDYESAELTPLGVPAGTYDILLSPVQPSLPKELDTHPRLPISSISLRGVQVDSNTKPSLRVEGLAPSATPFGKNSMQAFAIDPTSFTFTSGELALTAKGEELYKCAEWDFDSQTCGGEWVKIMEIVPGEEYIVLINSTDPAYAEYGSLYGAPVCANYSSPCIANSSLLQSRDTLATPEPNQPNTVDTCADGASGTYMADENVENITITSITSPTDVFNAGDSVNVTAWVYCWDGASDNINFVYSNSSASPTWAVVGFVDPCPAAGFNQVSAVFTIDDVPGNHVVRVINQYNGVTTTTCGAGAYDDNDDVVFAVNGTYPAQAKDAVIAYRSNSGASGTNSPKIRFWNASGTGAWGSAIELASAGSPVRWAVAKWSPVDYKIAVVTLSDNGYLDAYICTEDCDLPGSWFQSTDIGFVAATPAQRKFDIEFETTTGDLMVVYSVSSTVTTRDLAYKVLPANTTSFSGITEQYIDDSGHPASKRVYTWVRLDRKPTASKELAIVGFDSTGNDINAWVWNGSAWGNQIDISNAATATGGYEALAVRYSADGSKGMAIGGDGTNGNVNTRYWNGSSWSATVTFDVDPGDSNDLRWANLKADPATDDLQAVCIESGNDLGTAYWDGSTWAVTEPDAGLDPSTSRLADFEWDSTGSTGRLVWDTDGAGTALSQRACSPQCTGATSTISTYAGTGAWITLWRNPSFPSSQARILSARLNSAFDIGSFLFNGTAYSNYGDGIITTDTTVTTFEAYSIAFNITDTTPPSINFTPPTPPNNTIFYSTSVFINTSITDNMGVYTALLEWNGTNESMNFTNSTNWYKNKTGLVAGSNYTYKVWARDYAGNWNVSETRTLVYGTPPSVILLSPLGEEYPQRKPVSLAINATDPDGINLTYALVTHPNGTITNISLYKSVGGDNFDSNATIIGWFVENSSIGPSQTCTADINTTIPGKAYASLSGDGSPESDTLCSLVSHRAEYGDFDMQVSFEILNPGCTDCAINAQMMELPTSANASSLAYISLSNWTGLGRNYEVFVDDGILSEYIATVPTEDTYGKMRLNRTGNNFTFYVWNNTASSWILLNSTILNLSKSLFGALEVESVYPGWGSINATWDNLTIAHAPDIYFSIFNGEVHPTGTYNVTFYARDNNGAVNDSEKSNFTLIETNNPPSKPYILAPSVGSKIYDLYNITWSSVSDPDSDTLKFNITLLNPDGTDNATIISDYGDSSSLRYEWNTSEHEDGLYSLRVTVYENETPEGLSNSYTLPGTFRINNTPNEPPSVVILSPLGETYPQRKPVSLAINATDPDGINLTYAIVTHPNGTVSNITLYTCVGGDNFDMDSVALGGWWVENSSIGPSQTCIANINGTMPGKAYTSLSGNGAPESDTLCSLVSHRAIYGDFDMNVSFEILDSTGVDNAINFQVMELSTSANASLLAYISLSNWTGLGRNYEVFVDDGTISEYIATVPTDDTYGKMRIKREGSNFTFFVWNNTDSSWIELNSTELNLSGSLFVAIESESAYSEWGGMEASWDNLSIAHEEGSYFNIFNGQVHPTGLYNVTFYAIDNRGAVNDSEKSNFTLIETNNPPSKPYILAPSVGSSIYGLYNITWSSVSDPDGDPLKFNVTLLNPDGTDNATIISDYGDSSSVRYEWDTTAYPDGEYSMRVLVYENETAEELSNSYTLPGTFRINNNVPSVIVLSPLGESYPQRKPVSLAINATDPDGINLTYAIVNHPNGTITNISLYLASYGDNFDSNATIIGWFFENSSIGPSQTCIANINGTIPGKAFTSLSGDGSPMSDTLCSMVTHRAEYGDFDMHVSFEILAEEGMDYAINAQMMELPTSANSTRMVFISLSNWEGLGRNYEVFVDDGTISEYIATVPTTDTYGKMRLNRTGDNFTFYVWNNTDSSWIELNSTILNLSKSLFGAIESESAYPGWGTINASWDNLTIAHAPDIYFSVFNGEVHPTGLYNVSFYAFDNYGAVNDSEKSNFTLIETNNPPSKPFILAPYVGEAVQSPYNITWSGVTDPDGDSLNFNITLLNPDGTDNATIVSNYGNASSTNYAWDTTLHPDGVYSMRVTVFENETPEGLSNSYTLPGIFYIDDDLPSVIILSPLGENYSEKRPVSISINTSDSDGISSAIARITLPNGSIENLTLEKGQQSDGFETDSVGINWSIEDSLTGPLQTCTADIDTSILGKAYTSLSGDGTPDTDTLCTMISNKAVDGDFDMQIDFNIETETGTDHAINFQLTRLPSSANAIYTIFISLSNWTGLGRNYEIFADDGNFSGYILTRPTDDTYGKMRIKREGNNFTFYTWNNTDSSWIEEAVSQSEFNFSRAVYVSFESESAYPGWGTLAASWDNFTVTDTNTTFGMFNNTYALGLYNVSINVTDAHGRSNDSEKTNFTIEHYNTPPSTPFLLAPSPDETVAGLYNITWSKVNDFDGDSVQFNITLLNPDSSFNSTIASYYGDIDSTSFEWNTTAHADGNYSMEIIVFENETAELLSNSYALLGNFTIDNTGPVIWNATATPDPNGFGFNTTIRANVTDVATVEVGITPPGGAETVYLMENVSSDIYEYNYSFWINGTYNFTIYATDMLSQEANSTGYNFTLFQNLSIQVKTAKDYYAENETINITDPQGLPEPQILFVQVVPQKVVPGDTMHILAYASDILGVSNVTAYMPHESGTDEIPLSLASGTQYYGRWEGDWLVHDTVPKEYNTTIIAMNGEGSYSQETITWWDPPGVWILPSGDEDPTALWTNRPDARDGDTDTYSSDNSNPGSGWGSFIYLNTTSIKSDRVKVWADYGAQVNAVDIDVYNGSWVNAHEGPISNLAWFEANFTETDNITAARFRYNYTVGGWIYWLYEFQFYNITTVVNKPSAVTQAATSIEEDFAILHGLVTGDGGTDCQMRFLYGTTTSYGNATSWMSPRYTGDTADMRITGLEDGTTYHFLVQINNSAGTSNGSDQSFTTGPAEPGWVSPTGYSDPSVDWEDHEYAFDDSLVSSAQSFHASGDPNGQWSSYLYLNRTPEVHSDRIRFNAKSTDTDLASIDVYNGTSWINVYNASFTGQEWVAATFNETNVTQARIQFHVDSNGKGMYWRLYEFDFYKEAMTPHENQSKLENMGPTDASCYLFMKTQFWNGSSWEEEDIVVNETSPIQLGPLDLLKLDTLWNPLNYSTNNLSFGSGEYRIYAACLDNESNVLMNLNGTFVNTTYNFTYDSYPPNVTIISPINGTNYTLTSAVPIWANVTDEYGISTVQANVSNAIGSEIVSLLFNSTSGLWEYTYLNTNYVGEYRILIIATDISGAVNDTEFVYINVIDDAPPVVVLDYPIDNYVNNSAPPVSVDFRCNATDNYNVENISLYITNPLNSSFSLNQTENVSGVSAYAIFNLNLEPGVYTWNCEAYDSSGNSDWGDANRTITIGSSLFDCAYLSVPNGNYSLGADLFANKSDSICLTVNAPDITLDCAGFSITGLGGNTSGIAIINTSGVSIENCVIGNYSSAFLLQNANDSYLRNNTGFSSEYGIFIDPSYNNTIIENQLFNNSIAGLLLEDSHNNTIRNNTAYNNTNGIHLNYSSNNSLSLNNASNNSNFGIAFDYSNLTSITENTVNGNGNDGIAGWDSDSANISSNTALNNSGDEIFLIYSTGSTISYNLLGESIDPYLIADDPLNHTLYGEVGGPASDAIDIPYNSNGFIFENNGSSVYAGVRCDGCTGMSVSENRFSNVVFGFGTSNMSGSNITLNNVSTSSSGCFYLIMDVANNTFSGNTLHNCSYNGIYLDSGLGFGSYNNSFSGNTLYNTSPDSIYVMNSIYNTFSYNIIFNSSWNCLSVHFSNHTAAIYNNVSDCGNDNIAFHNSYYTNISYNTLYDTGSSAIFSNYSNINYIIGNNIVNSPTYDGINCFNNTNNFILDNNITNVAQIGVRCDGCVNVHINNTRINTANVGVGGKLMINSTMSSNYIENSNDGFYFVGEVTNNQYTSNIISNCTYGFYFDTSTHNNNLTNNTVYNSSNAAVYLYNSTDFFISGDHYSSNGRAFVINTPANALTYNLSGVIFDSPAGNYTNYTNLSINDILEADAAGRSFQIKWSAQPAALPSGFISFSQKFINITNLTNSISIDYISWSWQDSELPGYNENYFELWRYNSSGWAMLNDTPDTSANTLSQYSMDPASEYGILQNDGCRDDDGDGANYSYVPGACAGQIEDCDDSNKYLVPPFNGLMLSDQDQVYTLCPGIYYVNASDGPAIRIDNHNVTLNCNGTTIIGNGRGTLLDGYHSEMEVKNCIISNYTECMDLGWGQNSIVHNNTLTFCTYGLNLESFTNGQAYGNTILQSEHGIYLYRANSSLIYNNTIESQLFGYYASNQHLTYSGEVFDNNENATFFVPSNIFSVGGEPCYVTEDGDSLFACAAFNGETNLSVILNDLSPFSFGFNTTIIIDGEFNNCSDADNWWDSQLGTHPPCYAACVLYTANGAGNNYTLNESCYNATMNVSAGLTYPPYVNYGPLSTYGIELEKSDGNLVYNNIFNATYPATDDNNGTFSDYFSSLSPVTYNGVEYLGNPPGYNYTRFLYNIYDGEIGWSNEVHQDGYLFTDDPMDGTINFGMFVAYFPDSGRNETVYFDTSEFGWGSCTDVENALYGDLTSGDCKAFCGNILTANGAGQNYTFDDSCLNSTFNITSGYTYPPYLSYIAYSVSLNDWNTTQQLGPNIIGGQDIGGNFYSDYLGMDTNGDGIGDIPPYYDITDSLSNVVTTDGLPLTNLRGEACVNLSDPSTYQNKVVNVSGTYYVNSNVTLCTDTYYSNTTLLQINASDIYLDCNASALVGDQEPPYIGIDASSQNNVSITNCTISNFSIGVQFYNSTSSSLSHSELFENSENGDFTAALFLFFSTGTSITNNSIHDNYFFGTMVGASPNTIIMDNSMANNSVAAIFVAATESSHCDNTILNNTGGYYGTPINYTYNVDGITFENVNNEYSEIIWCGVNNSVMRNVTIFNGPGQSEAILVTLSFNNSLYDISSHNNFLGLYMGNSHGNLISNSTFHSTAFNAVMLGDSTFNTILNISAHSTPACGLSMENSHNNTILSSEFAHSGCGADIDYSENTTLSGNFIFNNSYTGAIVEEANSTSLTGDRFSNNGMDFRVISSFDSRELSLSGVLFLNPYGTLENYTNLSIIDVVDADSEYTINWTTNSSSLPAGYSSFRQKFINISTVSGTTSINEITWHWLESELPGYDENYFELWKYNASGWEMLNNTPDTTNNWLKQYDMDPESDYGILNNASGNCPVISLPGYYTQTVDYIGAPNNATPLATYACVKIISSDVTFDCNGYNITDNGTTGTTYGILSVSASNVTIRNCNGVSNYTNGLYLYDNNNSLITNSTAFNSSYGFHITGSRNSTITNSTAYNITNNGFYIYLNSAGSTVSNSIVYNSLSGFVIAYSSAGNFLENNTAYENDYGFIVSFDSSSNRIYNNTAQNNTLYGFETFNSANSTFLSNTAYNQSYGFYVHETNSSPFISNTMHTNMVGLWLVNSSQNNFTNNSAYGNSANGIMLMDNSSYNTLTDNQAYNNSQVGFFLYNESSYNTFTNDSAYNNTEHGFVFLSSHNNNITGARAYTNLENGFMIASSNNNRIENSLFYNNTNTGFIFGYTSESNSLTNSSSYYNGEVGFVIMENSSNNNMTFSQSYGNGFIGFAIVSFESEGCTWNLLLNNTAYGNNPSNQTLGDIPLGGFILYNLSSGNTLINNSAHDNNHYGFALHMGSNENEFTSNSAYNNSVDGFELSFSDSNTLLRNSAHNNTGNGYYLISSTGNNLTENTADLNSYNGYTLSASSGNFLFSNNATYESGNGFSVLASSENNTIENNIAHSNAGAGGNSGFQVQQSNLNNLTANTAYNNTQHGFFIQESNFTRLINNIAYNNSFDGIQLFIDSDNNTLIGNSAYNNSQNGIWLDRNCTGNLFTGNSMHNNAFHGIYFSQNSSENTLSGNNMTENGNTGVTLAADVYSNSFTDNFICFNPQDISNSSALSSGTLDYCDSWSNWAESGHAGCTFRCTTVWHRFYGQVNGSLLLAPNNVDMFYTWAWNGQNGKLYALNGDAVIEWINLTALGRNTSGGNSTNDFTELDTLLGISTEPDNINATYSYDGSNPKETADLTLFEHLVQYVPQANSSVFTAGFTTGIAWDASQGGTQFNTTLNQDVVFVSQINGSAPNDYEIMVPGTLDTYKGGSGVVEFWVELD